MTNWLRDWRVVMLIIIALLALAAALSSCDKYGAGGTVGRLVGNWVELKLPEGCKARQIAAEEHGGVAVLCDDGRIFH